tara:strand:+ start:843 stop:1145 length:303 start_codon:yes stop_codon:yes gene_type:complete
MTNIEDVLNAGSGNIIPPKNTFKDYKDFGNSQNGPDYDGSKDSRLIPNDKNDTGKYNFPNGFPGNNPDDAVDYNGFPGNDDGDDDGYGNGSGNASAEIQL